MKYGTVVDSIRFGLSNKIMRGSSSILLLEHLSRVYPTHAKLELFQLPRGPLETTRLANEKK